MALWATDLVGVVLVLGGGFGDGDVAVWVEGAELVQEAAGPAVGVGLAGVPSGAEFGVAGFGAGEEVPDDDEDGTSDGASGPAAPRRRDRRRSRSPRKVSVVAAPVAAWVQ